jgi:hypothetical protein
MQTRFYGCSPLHHAVDWGQEEVTALSTALLLQKGADVNAKCGGLTLLQKAVRLNNIRLAGFMRQHGSHE